jgi:capsular polysaccharide biosynthesis protein
MIVILTLCFMGIGCAGFVFMKGFQYTNQVSFLLPATETAKEDEGEDELEVENQVISSNIKLIETYKEMIKSDSLLQAIQEDYPQQSKQQLLDSLTVSNSINSQIFTVSITTKSPEQSNEIAMSLSEKFPQIVKQSSLPRDVFLLSAETAETVRTPGFSKLLIGAWFDLFI